MLLYFQIIVVLFYRFSLKLLNFGLSMQNVDKYIFQTIKQPLVHIIY